MNPGLTSHSVYSPDSLLEDDLRILFTRLRVGSHRLRVETGRWARTPHEERLCQCGEAVQTEKHVVAECNLVGDIRQRYGQEQLCFHTFVTREKSIHELNFLREVLDFYE